LLLAQCPASLVAGENGCVGGLRGKSDGGARDADLPGAPVSLRCSQTRSGRITGLECGVESEVPVVAPPLQFTRPGVVHDLLRGTHGVVGLDGGCACGERRVGGSSEPEHY